MPVGLGAKRVMTVMARIIAYRRGHR